jgi:hypothetical protein
LVKNKKIEKIYDVEPENFKIEIDGKEYEIKHEINEPDKKGGIVIIINGKKYEITPEGFEIKIDGKEYEIKYKVSKINIKGNDYEMMYIPKQPYDSMSQMKEDVTKNGILKTSIDYSDHPVFSLEDNIVFRTVHDYIVHILGKKEFGRKGEIQSYNLHTKLVPREAVPALFTEVVGQASVAVVTGDFPVQKIAVLKGFDYYNIGYVEGYKVKDKELSTADEDKGLVEYGELYERLKKKINMLNNR